MEKNIVVVTGSRSEYGLLEPVLLELKDRKSECNLKLLVTGSHLSERHGYTAQYIDAGLKRVLIPGLVDFDQALGVCLSMANFLPPLASAMYGADKVVLLGDRYEILAAALAAYNQSIPIAHIQGGDVTTGSLDDGYRDCITRLADEHYVATYDALDNVQRIQKSNKQHVVGSLACVVPDIYANEEYGYVVVVHPSKDDIGPPLLAELAELPYKMLLIGANADAGGSIINNIMKMMVEHKSEQFDYVESLPRKDFLAYLKGAKALIGNSSCGIFEAPMLKTPSINIGSRQNGRLRADSVYQVDNISDGWVGLDGALTSIEYSTFTFNCPYFKEGTVNNIVKGLLR